MRRPALRFGLSILILLDLAATLAARAGAPISLPFLLLCHALMLVAVSLHGFALPASSYDRAHTRPAISIYALQIGMPVLYELHRRPSDPPWVGLVLFAGCACATLLTWAWVRRHAKALEEHVLEGAISFTAEASADLVAHVARGATPDRQARAVGTGHSAETPAPRRGRAQPSQ